MNPAITNKSHGGRLFVSSATSGQHTPPRLRQVRYAAFAGTDILCSWPKQCWSLGSAILLEFWYSHRQRVTAASWSFLAFQGWNQLSLSKQSSRWDSPNSFSVNGSYHCYGLWHDNASSDLTGKKRELFFFCSTMTRMSWRRGFADRRHLWWDSSFPKRNTYLIHRDLWPDPIFWTKQLAARSLP